MKGRGRRLSQAPLRFQPLNLCRRRIWDGFPGGIGKGAWDLIRLPPLDGGLLPEKAIASPSPGARIGNPLSNGGALVTSFAAEGKHAPLLEFCWALSFR
jgi:hypothetical protein